MDHWAVIAALGGCTKLAAHLGRHPSTVAHWAHRGIPPLFWHEIAAMPLAQGLGITAAALADAAPQPGFAPLDRAKLKRRKAKRAKRKATPPPTQEHDADGTQTSERSRRSRTRLPPVEAGAG